MSKRDILLRKPAPAYGRLREGAWERAEAFAEEYKAFLDAGKTERNCVREAVLQAEKRGYARLAPGTAQTHFYAERHGKALILVRTGTKPAAAGLRIVAAHIDSPRIDLKPYPLYEKDGFALFKTHYYGGIKKYHWLTAPLELRGVVYLRDGTAVSIAPAENEPVLFISDVLPHLGKEQEKKAVSEAFPGESLNVTVGTVPDREEAGGPAPGDERIKLAVLSLLNRRYGMTEHDFQSAELCLVPAGRARDAGLDASMIAAYGQDDRSCAYAAMRALFDAPEPEYTGVCILADKEEIGSEGVTGMQSAFFDTVLEGVCLSQGGTLRECYQNSFCFSGDVTNAFDPNFPDVSDPQNNARLGYGPCVMKATGRGGKSGSSDASAETMSRTRRLLDGADVCWQMGELGKVDAGGGGTVAKYLAMRNIEVVDVGVPVLNMHAPTEVTAKIDCFETYRAFAALYNDR
ncbi:MAG: aminopeptidase [Oscillospiraceae bacterium]|jgi:aspartyl aminopeptidase|nr:aminopeptidase [Oscillospiraceae bacterium]